jgi:putative endonuclease
LKSYWVYILSSKTGTLYVGITGNLERRIYEHKNKLVQGFTSKYNIDRLVYFQEFNRVEDAIEMEKKLKGWSRQKKIDLIHSINQDTKDLAEELI